MVRDSMDVTEMGRKSPGPTTMAIIHKYTHNTEKYKTEKTISVLLVYYKDPISAVGCRFQF